jgi:glycolate oxidase FAD binding subunit
VNPGQPTSAQTVQPETLAEISVAMADVQGQVFFNAGEILHPFGFPTPYRRMWMKSLGQKMEAEGFPPPPEFRGITLTEDDFVALLTTTGISLDDYTGIIEHDVDDQVVVVRAGTPLLELQYELGKVGQCIPIPTLEPPQAMATATIYAPLIDEIGYNLPHGLSAQCGSWRDWILGMKVVQPDGTVVKCGSKAVKNVAGYDVQKLMIGARGTLGLIAEVTLKTYPLKALPSPEVVYLPRQRVRPANWVQRVRPVDLQKAVEAHGNHLSAYDPKSSTLWAVVPPEETLPRFEGDWLIRSGCGAKNLEFADEAVRKLMYRTKGLFDPTGKMNRGEMGIF